MKRILLDTNIYELILRYLEIEKLRSAAKKSTIIFYGVNIIRKELRDIPRDRKDTIRDETIKLRNVLLSLYDTLVGNHTYNIDIKTNALADDYYIAYKVLGGKVPKDEIVNDFRIVASASIHNLDIVVSEDKKTMLSDVSLKSFSSVNEIQGFRTPNFIGFQEFKKLLGGVNLD